MPKLVFNPDENVFVDQWRFMLQGKRIKFPVLSRCVLTDQRFVYFDLGKAVALYVQIGFLMRLFIKGKPVSMPLNGLVLSRGKYAMNKKILSITTSDGTEALLDRYEKSLEWFQNALAEHGLSMTQTGEEEWVVQI